MKLRDLTKETKKLEFTYKTSSGDFVINLEYRPQAVTVAFLDEINDLLPIDRLTYQMEKLVVSWDLQDDNDKIIPITQKALAEHEVPIYLLNTIIEAITADRLLFTAEAKKD